MVAQRALVTVSFVVLSRLLVPRDFGVVALATVLVVVLVAIAESGMGRALVRVRVLTDEHIDTAFWAGTIWAVLLAGLLVGFAHPLAVAFGDDQVAPLIAALSSLLVLSGLDSVQLGLAQRELRFRQISLRQIAGSAAGAVIGVIVAILGGGPWALVAQSLSAQVISVAALWFLSSWRPKFRFSTTLLRELLASGLAFMTNSISGTVQRNLDNLIVGSFLGVVTLGFYSVAYRMFTLLCSLTVDATTSIGLPTFAKLAELPERMVTFFYRAMDMSCRVTCPAFAFLAVEGTNLITATSGDRWHPAGRLLVALGPAGVIQGFTAFDAPVLFARGQLRGVATLNVLTALTTAVAFVVGVQFGSLGVAAGYSGGLLVMWPLRVWLLSRAVPLNVGRYLRHVLRSLVICVPLVLALVGWERWGVTPNRYVNLALAMTIGVTVYLPLAWWADRETAAVFQGFVASAVRRRRAAQLARRGSHRA